MCTLFLFGKRRTQDFIESHQLEYALQRPYSRVFRISAVGRLLPVLKDRIRRKAVKEILESRRPDIALHAARCKGLKATFKVPL